MRREVKDDKKKKTKRTAAGREFELIAARDLIENYPKAQSIDGKAICEDVRGKNRNGVRVGVRW